MVSPIRRSCSSCSKRRPSRSDPARSSPVCGCSSNAWSRWGQLIRPTGRFTSHPRWRTTARCCSRPAGSDPWARPSPPTSSSMTCAGRPTVAVAWRSASSRSSAATTPSWATRACRRCRHTARHGRPSIPAGRSSSASTTRVRIVRGRNNHLTLPQLKKHLSASAIIEQRVLAHDLTEALLVELGDTRGALPAGARRNLSRRTSERRQRSPPIIIVMSSRPSHPAARRTCGPTATRPRMAEHDRGSDTRGGSRR
jgi:hypothetical protein